MQIIADLQLHSKYSRAVSPRMDLDEIARWSSKKGINLVATGDWTHPLWFREIATKLKEVSSGIYELKERPIDQLNDVHFLLSSEISSIYTQGGKQRRVHNLIFSPSVTTCEKIIKELNRRGCNLMADGRPIVGLSSKELLRLCLEIDKNILFIPAHAWTPWFSIFGSKSGFDSIEECFEELSDHIYAIETGLSSDPVMNWQIKELETRSIVSFSDAHSGPKLGREATIFKTIDPDSIGADNKQLTIDNISYSDIALAIKQDPESKLEIACTLEFFPEEGKYHYTGHRDCDVRLTPDEVVEKGIICPKCGRVLTVGVEEQVRKLAYKIINPEDLQFVQNKNGVTFVYDKAKKRKPFVSLVPLLEILTETTKSPTKASAEYERLISSFGTEFDILLYKPYEEIEKAGGQTLKEAIRIVRERKVFVDPGYDGVFGKVKIFKEKDDKKNDEKQASLF